MPIDSFVLRYSRLFFLISYIRVMRKLFCLLEATEGPALALIHLSIFACISILKWMYSWIKFALCLNINKFNPPVYGFYVLNRKLVKHMSITSVEYWFFEPLGFYFWDRNAHKICYLKKTWNVLAVLLSQPSNCFYRKF